MVEENAGLDQGGAQGNSKGRRANAVLEASIYLREYLKSRYQ